MPLRDKRSLPDPDGCCSIATPRINPTTAGVAAAWSADGIGLKCTRCGLKACAGNEQFVVHADAKSRAIEASI